ncbi:MAG: hypothetical protein OEW75_15625, partial [Cyclobacteriaceae bacterium]|nr:hypothetical protein [Cyclobacteriaceae bacterium]
GMFHYKNPIKGNWYWVQKYSAGMYFSEYQFDNDRFRPGGVNSLRGYLDREFFADQFLLMQSEFRYYSTKSTYFNFFYDAGILSRIKTSNKLMGFGLGMNVETGKKGWLQCYMALGKREKNKIDISQTLVHVGYIAKF